MSSIADPNTDLLRQSAHAESDPNEDLYHLANRYCGGIIDVPGRLKECRTKAEAAMCISDLQTFYGAFFDAFMAGVAAGRAHPK